MEYFVLYLFPFKFILYFHSYLFVEFSFTTLYLFPFVLVCVYIIFRGFFCGCRYLILGLVLHSSPFEKTLFMKFDVYMSLLFGIWIFFLLVFSGVPLYKIIFIENFFLIFLGRSQICFSGSVNISFFFFSGLTAVRKIVVTKYCLLLLYRII